MADEIDKTSQNIKLGKLTSINEELTIFTSSILEKLLTKTLTKTSDGPSVKRMQFSWKCVWKNDKKEKKMEPVLFLPAGLIRGS